MRILVISDSHRRGSIVDRIIERHPDAAHVFFLGDVTGDIEDLQYAYGDKKFHIVSGNCDFGFSYPTADIQEISGTKIFYTHGHNYHVKYGTTELRAAALARGCKIALFGHTHIPLISYEDGLYIVNPGSCAQSREGANSYAVIDIEKNGIMPIIVRL